VRTHLWTAALLVLAGASLPAHAQTKLEWKFNEGEKFYIEDVTDQKVSMSLMGQDIKMASKTTQVTSYTVKRKAGDAVTMEMKIESIDVKAENNPLGGGMDKFQEKFQGATFTFTLENGKVTKLDGFDAFLKKLGEGDENFAKFGKLFLTEDTIKKTIEDAFTQLPTRAVNQGDKWTKDQTVPMGPLGNLKQVKNYTYQGKEKDGEQLAYKGTVAWTAPKAGAAVGDLFKITKANFKSDDVRGTVLFDAARGRLVRSTSTMTLKGSMTMDVMGNEIEIEMAQDSTTTSRVLTRNPKVD
jgi:hypothetical protein